MDHEFAIRGGVHTLLLYLIQEYNSERLKAALALFENKEYARAFRFFLKQDRSLFTQKDLKTYNVIKEVLKDMSRQKDSYFNLRNAVLKYRKKSQDTMSVKDFSGDEQLRIKQVFSNMYMHEANLEDKIKVEPGGKNYVTGDDQITMSLDLIIASPAEIFNSMIKALRLNAETFKEDLLEKGIDKNTAEKVKELLNEYFPKV